MGCSPPESQFTSNYHYSYVYLLRGSRLKGGNGLPGFPSLTRSRLQFFTLKGPQRWAQALSFLSLISKCPWDKSGPSVRLAPLCHTLPQNSNSVIPHCSLVLQCLRRLKRHDLPTLSSRLQPESWFEWHGSPRVKRLTSQHSLKYYILSTWPYPAHTCPKEKVLRYSSRNHDLSSW